MLADSKQTNPSDHITATPALSVSTVSETPKALVPSSSGCSLGISDQTRVVYNTSATIAKEPSPNFSPLIQRHLEERTIDVVWNKFIGETANYYYGKFPNIDSTDQYRAIGEKMYTQYPCIKNEGNQPWSLFTKCLSQRIRHMRLRLKRKSQPEIPNSNPKPKSAKTFKTVEREQGPEEDEKAHIKELGEEWKKSAKKRNSAHIRTLLNETRRYREKLVQKSPRLLKEIVSAVPCFTEGEFIVYEFKRKYGKEKLEAMCRNMEILVLACHDLMGKPLEKNSLKSEENDLHREILQAIGFMENGSKFDRGKSGKSHYDTVVKVFEDVDDSSIVKKLQTKEETAPRLIAIREENQLKAVFIVGDEVIIKCYSCCLLLSMVELMCTYYVFDIEYPKCYSMIMTIFQVLVVEESYKTQTSKKFNFFIKKLKPAFCKQKQLHYGSS